MSNEMEQSKQVNFQLARIFNVFTLVAGSYCAIFGYVFYLRGDQLLTAVLGLGLLVTIINYPIIRATKQFNRGVNVILFIGNVIVVFLFVTGGIDGTGQLYPLIYLPFAAFITNRKYTTMWVVILAGCCLAALGLHIAGIITMPYTTVGLFSYFFGLAVLIVCIFLFQRNTIDYEEFIKTREEADLTIRRQAALVQMLPDAVIYSDLQNRIVSMNAGAEKMLGVSGPQATGKQINQLLNFVSVHGEQQKGGAMLDATLANRNEFVITNQLGEQYTILANVKMLEQQAGHEAGRVTIYTDISILKVNEELKEVLAKVEKNNEYLEQLAYISAHDIKSPIITVEGLVDLLSQNPTVQAEGGQIMRLLTNTVKQMRRTNLALNNVLKVRKNLMQGIGAKEQYLPFKQIMAEVTTTLQVNIDEANAKFEVDTAGVDNELFPGVQFKSVFQNLLSNAIKYRSADRPLQIKVSASVTPQGDYTFSVSDTGLGMDLEENKEKLFGIFKRFHLHVEGSGVGLHIVRSIVEAYGGRIEVQSVPDGGTTFTIHFNRATFV